MLPVSRTLFLWLSGLAATEVELDSEGEDGEEASGEQLKGQLEEEELPLGFIHFLWDLFPLADFYNVKKDRGRVAAGRDPSSPNSFYMELRFLSPDG